MDDITRKRLESERSHMGTTVPDVVRRLADTEAMNPSNFEAHNVELYKLGLPRHAKMNVAPLLLGIPIGMMMNHTTAASVLDFFNTVVRADVDADLINEPYDNVPVIGDALEDYYESLEHAAKVVNIDFQVELLDVFLWARLIRNAVAEFICSIEEANEITLDFEEAGSPEHKGMSLVEIRAVAARVARFMTETLATAIQDQRERPQVS